MEVFHIQKIVEILSNEIVFWLSWVLIPIIMEIIPAVFGSFILIKKWVMDRNKKELTYYPDITLILPIYNSSTTLRACLDSVYNSTYPNEKIMIILVNNESKDDSYSVYLQYLKEHSDIRMTWMNAKQGKSRALNMALYNSEGKYIIHIDSDGVLDKNAIKNLVQRFEADENIHCMTGAVLTTPELVKNENNLLKRIMKTTEFFEYCQAFIIGRNFESELDMIFTMSGAFSCFRKSTILRTRLYNTETVCEDTHITFQVRYILNKKIDICENAIFYVDPIDSMEQLYVQRQRWQRGQLEVVHMFPPGKNIIKGFFTNFLLRLMVFDHTFAFPRMIWYFALFYLTFLNYPFKYIVISIVVMFTLYILSTFINYLCVCAYLYWNKDLVKFYAKRIQYVCLLPVFNFITYWFRLAGIINSINGARSWSTRSFKEEITSCIEICTNDFLVVKKYINKIRVRIYKNVTENKGQSE